MERLVIALLLVLTLPGLLTFLPTRSRRNPDGGNGRTKRENCTHLMREHQGRLPTDEELARCQLTRPEYEHFLHRQAASRAKPTSPTQVGLDGDRNGRAER